MFTTQSWADSLNVPGAPASAGVANAAEPASGCERSAREIALRAVILHGVVGRAFGADGRQILNWFDAQKISRELTSRERTFLENSNPSRAENLVMKWHCEAAWTMLWMIGKVQELGLPTTPCDIRRMVDELMPAMGADIKPFLKSAKLRTDEELSAENQRTLTLYRSALALKREERPLPGDLIFNVLYERRYAFEWRNGKQAWDKVSCE